MSRAREQTASLGPLSGGVTFYPYQWSLGVSVRYWRCLFAPAFSVYLGPLKLWAYFSLRRKRA